MLPNLNKGICFMKRILTIEWDLSVIGNTLDISSDTSISRILSNE